MAHKAQAAKQRAARKQTATRLALLFALAFGVSGCIPRPRVKTIPPPPIADSLVANPSVAYPGDPITVTSSIVDRSDTLHVTYTWTLDGNTIPGNRSMTIIDTRNLSPGIHTLLLQEANLKQSLMRLATSITILPFEPPTISCSSSPMSVSPGESATITASAASPQSRPLFYRYSSSAGSVAGNTGTATLSTVGAAPGQIVITCYVIDDKGHTASTTTTVSVSAPSAPPRHIGGAPMPGGGTFPPPTAIGPKPPRCSATPTSVRPGPGKVVTLTVEPTDLRPGDHVHWTTDAVESLDQDAAVFTVDTGGLSTGTHHATAFVTNPSESRRCDIEFTVTASAPLSPWHPVRPASGLLPRNGPPESRGFALYTYVLMGTRPTNPSDTLRLHNIVKQVLSKGTAEAKGQQSVQQTIEPLPHSPQARPTGNVILAAQLSVIYIPVRSIPPASIASDDEVKAAEAEATWIVDQGHYDIDRASALLLRPACLDQTPNCRQELSGSGPFLVTTLIRLSTNRPSSILIQNLQGTTPEMAGPYVEDFLDIIAVQHNWNSMTFRRLRNDLSLNFDRDGQTMFAIGTAKTQVLAMFGFSKK